MRERGVARCGGRPGEEAWQVERERETREPEKERDESLSDMRGREQLLGE